jgi:hypothetical protein
MPPFVGSFIRVNGKSLGEHAAQARQIGINMGRVAEEDLDAACAEAMSTATTLVPVITGYLRSTIFISKIGRWEYILGAFADYAGFVEYGNSRRPAKPYWTPAILKLKETLPQVLVQDMRNAVMGP